MIILFYTRKFYEIYKMFFFLFLRINSQEIELIINKPINFLAKLKNTNSNFQI